MAKAPDMSPDFARWYADAFMDEGATREARWKGVTNIAAKGGFMEAEVLARLAFQTTVPAAGRKSEDLGDTYKTVVTTLIGGSSLDQVQSARELQILAAAALTRLFQRLPDAALAVTTTSFSGMRKLDLPMDLVGLAENAIVSFSQRKHERVGGDKLKLTDPVIAFEVAPEAITTMDGNQWKAQFDKLHETATAAIELVVEEQNRINALLHRRLMLDEEELQMLWWLVGGNSRLLEQPFPKLDPLVRPLALAQELASMTSVSPGPTSIRAMLSRAGVGIDKLALRDAVNAANADWAKSASSSKRISPATTPIHFALEQRSELGSTETWQASWTSLTGLSADVSLPGAKLAELFYREFLFLHVGE
ncbi:GTPase-associated system all-helical protein GASH [Mesorhizobium erdmanii]|uniref:GTPase-associated system helical domain-containing protein n=1 Tax=Mesorhizobium erdmanii TaxID=1777866 RepID=A0A6M7UM32_9HYPH|nr:MULTISPECIES: GTPase-associated system all-helical protein GASH [Mesorhizobium]OBQ58633.1 hypothetical protein A8146_22150 [Mesorhizobium loti]QKC77892.1 hypothetical protein EB233_22305 [Mesorhizobium erdmanii]